MWISDKRDSKNTRIAISNYFLKRGQGGCNAIQYELPHLQANNKAKKKQSLTNLINSKINDDYD